mmetsp:Transcript_25630/g.36134  ORF Transcript_25630/g.36134 Transcript_25630/m.36134 type:complete len:689 (+) Transcript_25630:1304-3370(+)
MRLLDGRNTLGTRGIHNGTKTNDSEPLSFRSSVDEFLSKLLIGLDRILVDRSTAKSKNTKTVGTQDSNLFSPVILVNRFEGVDITTLGLMRTKRNHAVGSTLHVNDVLAIETTSIDFRDRVVNSSHELVFGTERNFVNNRSVVLEGFDVDTTEVGSTEDRDFSGVSDFSFTSTVVTENTLTTQNTSGKGAGDVLSGWRFTSGRIFNRFSGGFFIGGSFSGSSMSGRDSLGINTIVERGHLLLAVGISRSTSREDLLASLTLLMLSSLRQEFIVADEVSVDTGLVVDVVLVASIGGDEGSERHNVLSEGTSLVGTNDGDTSKSLDGREGTDNSVLLGHVRHSISVGDSHDSFKTFGNHGNSGNQCNGNGVNYRQSGGKEGDQESNNGTNNNEGSKVLGNSINLFKHSGLLLFNLTDKGVNSTNLGVVTGCDGNTFSTSLGYKGGTEGHVATVSERCLFGVSALGDLDFFDDLVNGDRFSSEGSLLTSKIGRVDDTHVARNLVSKAEQDEVARNKVNGREHLLLTATNDTSITGKHILEGFSSFFCRTFLNDTDPGVDSDNTNNNTNLNPVRDDIVGVVSSDGTDSRNNSNDNKDTDKNVGNLSPNTFKKSLLPGLSHLVLTVFGKTGSGLCFGETILSQIFVTFELLHSFLNCHCVPGSVSPLVGTCARVLYVGHLLLSDYVFYDKSKR